MKILSNFAIRLRDLRKSKGLTQKQAAEIFQVAERHWQRYESGEQTPTFDGLLTIAEHFDVSFDWLTARTDNPDSHKV